MTIENYGIPQPPTQQAPALPPLVVGSIYAFVSKSGSVVNGKLTACGQKNFLVINLVTGEEIMLDKQGIVDCTSNVKHAEVTSAAISNAVRQYQEYHEEDGAISVGEHLLSIIRDGGIHLVFWEPKP